MLAPSSNVAMLGCVSDNRVYIYYGDEARIVSTCPHELILRIMEIYARSSKIQEEYVPLHSQVG